MREVLPPQAAVLVTVGSTVVQQLITGSCFNYLRFNLFPTFSLHVLHFFYFVHFNLVSFYERVKQHKMRCYFSYNFRIFAFIKFKLKSSIKPPPQPELNSWLSQWNTGRPFTRILKYRTITIIFFVESMQCLKDGDHRV